MTRYSNAMQKSPRADLPNLFCLDAQLPWTQNRYEAIADAVSNVRLSGEEISATTLVIIVRALAGEISDVEALQLILQQYLPSAAESS